MDWIFMGLVAALVGLGVMAITALIALVIEAIDERKQDKAAGLIK